jgi:CelD/BcsL family acetyltransferase involved in cellulose biosynthesis
MGAQAQVSSVSAAERDVSGFEIEAVSELEQLREEWTRLAEGAGNVFSTWDWASIWWRHFGNGRRLLLTACRDARGTVVAILPAYLSSDQPVRTVRFVGHGPADQLGPICDGDTALAAAFLRQALEQRAWPWDVFMAERLPGEQKWASLLRGRALEHESSPIMRAGSSWDEYLASRSSNFREQVRRRERKLAREHDLNYRLANRDSFDADFETLVRLHEARWGEEQSGAFAGRLKDFHREFASVALDRGWLRLWTMEVDGQAVAAWYGFRFAGAESYYQSGRDPDWDRYSVGFVLLTHTMREAFDDGVAEYRLLRGGEYYKSRFATHDSGVETIGLARGVKGRAALYVSRLRADTDLKPAPARLVSRLRRRAATARRQS